MGVLRLPQENQNNGRLHSDPGPISGIYSRPHRPAWLPTRRVFGYLFDFGDEWFHQAQVERIEQAIPTVTYPRIIKRVGKSPPQYAEE
jgi:hypothetical protein